MVSDTFPHITATGCDSIVNHHIVVNKPDTGHITVPGCEIAYYADKAYTESTTIEEKLTTTKGCDSTLFVHILVGHPQEKDTIIHAPYSYIYDGDEFTRDTVITRTFKNISGCDSTETAHLYIHQPTDTTIEGEYDVNYNGHRYIRSTVLRDTLTDRWGCDSFVTVAIVIKKSLDYPIVVNKYGYILLCNNNIGTTRYVTFQWYKDGSPIQGETKQYYEEDGKLDGCYQVYVNTDDGREYFSENLCIEQEKPLTLYPNPVPPNTSITIEYDFNEKQRDGLFVDVYNVAGVNVFHSTPAAYPIVIPGQSEKGYYFVLITTGEDKNMGAKFIVK